VSTFAADVAAWALNVEGAIEVIFREAAQELAREMDLLLEQTVYDQPISSSGYQRTGFLRASLVASSSVMPQLVRENPGTPVPPDLGDVILVINGAEIGGTIYLGYTANYAAFVHYSANGQSGRPWVTMAAQRWEIIVDRVSARVKSRLGL
tara:strand:- start:19865 stop:20317 length:453 start_codon:yes stop_codon:yes gene_type:complete